MIRKALAFGSDMTDTSPMSRPRAADRLGHAAFSQFVTVGADSLTMEGIAERAGVSIGAAYRWQPSLDEVVAQALRGALPALAQEIAAAESLDRWLQPRDLQDRLLTEALLAVRRFPSLSVIVRHALDTVGRGVDPLGLSVLVGTQAAMVAGCVLPSSARTALARLYERIRLTDPAGPLPWAPQTGGEFTARVEHSSEIDVDEIGERLIAATARVLVSPSEATVRSIAESAGVTTGAIYRRYESKDQLVADTIRAHLTTDRTTWAVPFVARLVGTQAGDPADVLAQQLALAGEPHAEQTRLAIEFIVASRVSPDARQVLVQRMTQAQRSRQQLFESMLQAGVFTRDDTPIALSWALQLTPTGARLLSLVSPQPDAAQWQPAMASLLRAL